MQSTAATVDAYLSEIPSDRREAIERLRRLARATLAGFEETMMHGMPCYVRDGEAEVAFASQKNTIALYIMQTDVISRYRDRLPRSAVGKGCIRFRNPSTIDFELVKEILTAAAGAPGGDVC
jgi:uncharacterized protein YdhG (YjbR/CyaY superfamily)